jgi:hypothetical protein
MIIKRSPSADLAKNQLPPRGSSNGDGITNGSVVFAETLQLEKKQRRYCHSNNGFSSLNVITL